MSVSTATASLTVTAGPDRGQTFALVDEFIHVGSGPDSQVLLSDPQVPEHLASLANRNGRFAIFTPIDGAISVDGNSLRADQWVWLPTQATIKATAKTTLTFQTGSAATPTPAPDTRLPDDSPPPVAAVKARRRATTKKSEGTTGRAVAKFITDRPGETLVRLGEDGHLPELALQEAATAKSEKRPQSSQGNPALVYGALGFSLLASIAMLFLEPQTFDERATSKSSARQAIVKDYIGDERGPAKPYQRLLREAGLAHARGDSTGERNAYIAVLGLLNSEDKNPYTGITGSADLDEQLKKYLAVLLSR
ncbi:MAG: hypothetical protein JSS49_00795 [Planctomycetes bacterium]|nr:hypothetical protein [Planctomycetota bacterium]